MSAGYDASDYHLKKTSVRFRTSCEKLQSVYDRCEVLCRENLQPFGTRKVLQEGAKYHGVWLETQPMGGEMYAKRDMEAALNNILVFMENQRRDGRMPGMITFSKPWSGLCVHQDWMQGDFFTIPAFRMYYHLGRDKAYLRRLYTALRDFDEYLWSYRDSDGNGCLESWCVWDTGDDNCTRYAAYQVDAVRNGAWNGEKPPCGQGKLPFESAEYMAYSYAHRSTLAEISKLLRNGEEKMWREKAEQVRARFVTYLWDDKKKYAFDRDGSNKKIPCLCLLNLKCMYQGIFTQEMADEFIRRHLLNPEEFWTSTPLPSIASNDPLFYLNPEVNNLGRRFGSVMAYMNKDAGDNSWSGPVEGLVMQRAVDALSRYGHVTEMAMVGKKWLKTLETCGRYVQQYNPFTGEPAKSDDGYGPTVLAALEYISRLCGVSLEYDRVTWGAMDSDARWTYTQNVDEDAYTLRKTAKTVKAVLNGTEIFRTTPGLQVTTSKTGVVRQIICMNETPVDMVLSTPSYTLRGTLSPNEVLTVAPGGNITSRRQIAFGAEGGKGHTDLNA